MLLMRKEEAQLEAIGCVTGRWRCFQVLQLYRAAKTRTAERAEALAEICLN